MRVVTRTALTVFCETTHYVFVMVQDTYLHTVNKSTAVLSTLHVIFLYTVRTYFICQAKLVLITEYTGAILAKFQPISRHS